MYTERNVVVTQLTRAHIGYNNFGSLVSGIARGGKGGKCPPFSWISTTQLRLVYLIILLSTPFLPNFTAVS